MHLGLLLLALVSLTTATNNCLVGNLYVSNNQITSKSVESVPCDGLCRKQTIKTTEGAGLVLLSCETNKLKMFINQGQEECSSSELFESSCFCKGDECNKVEMVENLPEARRSVDVENNILCYVGFYANNTINGVKGFGNGDTVTCASGNVCASINDMYQGYDASVFACMPLGICANIFPGETTGTHCTLLPGARAEACCCYDQDCTNLAPFPAPTPSPWNKNNQTCYSGISINGQIIAGGSFSTCLGECGSARMLSTFHGQNVYTEVFVCDPVNIFTSLGLNNECKNIDSTNINGVPNALLTGCACNTDKCLDPTVVPPIYPIRQLKCAVGLWDGSTWMGAEMECQGRCGRLRFTANGKPVSYFTCMSYDVCAGFGLESTVDDTYNPPQDEELQVFCCSSDDNCNVNNPDILARVTNSVVSTVKYPVLCYQGIHVNGVPITNSAYQMCQGECALADFLTSFAGNQHSATIYTCDPVSMCIQAGISNSCGLVIGGITACCCDNDLCLDPNRGAAQPQLKCYSGISIPVDNYNQGGDQVCDGWCASVSSNINGKEATVYLCAPASTCRSFGLGFGGQYGNCATIPGADPPVTGCCCSDYDNCLAPVGINITAVQPRPDPKIVCYEGIHINGQIINAPTYRMCDGQCVSVSMTGSVNSSSNYATIYTCDPSSSCAAMGIRNNCSVVDNTLTACCCDSDECIDPTVNRKPGKILNCYVGINTKKGGLNIGTQVQCDGYCASVATTIGNDYVTAFHCAPRSLCRALGLDNSQGPLYYDRNIRVSCCDIFDDCNAIGAGVDIKNIPIAPYQAPRVCYSGIFIGPTPISDGGWQVCQGDCVSTTFDIMYNKTLQPASLYTCDQATVCRQLNANDQCHQLEEGLEACCCTTDACIDPTFYPPVKPTGPQGDNICYVGAYSYDSSGNTILNVGGEQACSGECASVTSFMGRTNFTAYACVPNYVCTYLGLYDICMPSYYDRTIQTCCCTNGPNCNLMQVHPVPPPVISPGRPRREYPITCPAGLIVDGLAVTPIDFTVCAGDCASVTMNATAGAAVHTATLYTCDSTSICYQLGVNNNCGSPEAGITTCCCDTDACLDPARNKTVPTTPLKCYVGLYSDAVQQGAEQLCDGKCASVNARGGWGDNVTIFACVPHSLCRSLELYDECMTMAPYYPEFNACCCDNADNCNIQQTYLAGNISTDMPLSPLEDFPISCYSGFFINGTAFGSAGWQSCQGDCVSISLTSSFQGAIGTATLYTCDPSQVCRNLKLNNQCATFENGVSGCCCNTNGCIDPTVYPARTPGNPLYCIAGLTSDYAPNGVPLTVLAEIQCDGKCSSLSGIVGGNMVHSYHCTPSSVCRALELYDSCHPIQLDRQVTACCCDNSNNCNNPNLNITLPTPSTNMDMAIVCYSGLYVNGSAVTPITLGACQGQCASITLNTMINAQSTSATLFGCDPTSVCQALGMSNSCASPEPGLSGCCCNTDLCLDPPKGKFIPSGTRKCFAGIYAQGKATGSEILCAGKCASISAVVNTAQNPDPVTIFGCVPNQFCRQLELYDECDTIQTDRDITACCCDNNDNCNVDLANLADKVNTSTPVTNLRDYPITCYSGLFVNNYPVSTAGWQACQGECASATISTMVNGLVTNGTIYTCDPVSACYQLGMMDNCTAVETGLSTCCCSSDACLDPTVIPPKTPQNPLKCYVGLQSTYNGGMSLGAETYCQGQCASLTGIIGGQNVTTYHCVADSICKSLQLKDSCSPIYNDRAVTVCCCNNADNCNLKDPNVIPGPPVLPEFPTACYYGLWVDGQPYSKTTLGACNGDCASITMNTTFGNGESHSATLYTCDPTSVCQQLDLSNACHAIEPGVSGCCCDSDGCINPYTKTVPGPLACYVGVYTSDGKVNVGATVPCDGYCGSLDTTVNQVLYKSYHCVPKEMCRALGLFNQRRTVTTDKDINGYCCSTGTNCHVTEAAVNATNILPTPTMVPITCRSSVWINGVVVTADIFTPCYGQCAAVTYTTTASGATNFLTLYTCDPTSVCEGLGLYNSCASLDSGLSGCCCNSNGCVGPNDQPTPTPMITTTVGVITTAPNTTTTSGITTPTTVTPIGVNVTTSSGVTTPTTITTNIPIGVNTTTSTGVNVTTSTVTNTTTPTSFSTTTPIEVASTTTVGVTTPTTPTTITPTTVPITTPAKTKKSKKPKTTTATIITTTSSGFGISATISLFSLISALYLVIMHQV